jgi:formylglycine-generating enzyme required for sulfatase activity
VGILLDPATEVEMKFAWVPPGSFLMGGAGEDDEKPAHSVTITKGFYMGVVPVTQAQWRWVMGSDNRPSYFADDDRPVESVNWDDCQAFCARMRELTGKPIRLPTEAEWEYACRAGTTTDYYTGNGDDALNRAGWYDANSEKQTKPVGRLAPNAFGLFDMHGNVWEWCLDWVGSYDDEQGSDPAGPASGQLRVLRGGSWLDGTYGCRAAYRGRCAPSDRYSNFGSRVCFCLE